MNKNQAFNYNSLFTKAKLYIDRAFSVNRESELFPFWISLSLEFLARSTLAKISPTLLADTSTNNAENLLYALDYESIQNPKSINISSVFDRLTKVDIKFTISEKNLCNKIVNERNTELHSGMKGYEDFPVNLWLKDFYRICKILLDSQGLKLKDFLGISEAAAADVMIKEDVGKIKKDVMDRIQACKRKFLKLGKGQKEKLQKESAYKIVSVGKEFKMIKCPSCKSEAPLYFQVISESQPRLDGESISQEKRCLPTELHCYACGLDIKKYVELEAIELGSQFTIQNTLDPVEYHGIDVEELAAERMEYMDE